MQHFILTRLALGQPSARWLAHRLELFRTYCAPSVQCQTVSRFAWLLAVNPNVPCWFLKRIAQVAPQATLVYSESPQPVCDWGRLLQPFVRRGRLITSRLDNDDMIGKRYVEYIQRFSASTWDDFIIDFSCGYQLDLSDLSCKHKRMVFGSSFPTHFLSLVESVDRAKPRTAYVLRHCDMSRRYRVLCLGYEGWVEVCHGMNIINRISVCGSRVEWHSVKGRFI